MSRILHACVGHGNDEEFLKDYVASEILRLLAEAESRTIALAVQACRSVRESWGPVGSTAGVLECERRILAINEEEG